MAKSTTKPNIVVPKYNLLNLSSVELVKNETIKTSDASYKDLLSKYEKIKYTTDVLKFLEEKEVFNRSYIGRDDLHTLLGERLSNKVIKDLVKDIDSYNSNLKELTNKRVKLPTDLSMINYNLIEHKSSRSDYMSRGDYNFNYIKVNYEKCAKELNSRMFSDIKDIVALADSFGFAILPIEIAKDTICKCDPNFTEYQIKDAINKYRSFNKGKFFYVLCPLDFYDLMLHAKATKYHQVYFAKSLSALSLNIGMSLPLFRTLFESVGLLDERVKKLESTTESIKMQITNIESNIKIMQQEIQRLNEAQIQLRETQIAQHKELQRMEMERQKELARMIDPLIFCTESPITDFSISMPCEIGFAWGLEFPAAFIDNLGLKAKNELKPDWLKK